MVWLCTHGLLATLHAAGEDIGHITEMQTDMIAQAARMRFVPSSG